MNHNSTDSTCFRRTTCRLCESGALVLRLQLTACPPVDAFVTAEKKSLPQQAFPLDLFMCESCGHFQLLDVVNPALLFGDYIYTTSSSPGLVEHFKEYAASVIKMLPSGNNCYAVDIGSNDGTLLGFLKASGCKVLGIDPATEIARQATERGIETLNAFFNSQIAADVLKNHGKADIVTANNVFAHSDDLADMAIGVQRLLKQDGMFVFEVSYMLDMIDNMVFDFIYHEHLSHHSVRPLQIFLERHGLELFDVKVNRSKGGSLRCFAQLKGGPRRIESSVSSLIEHEEARGLYGPEIFKQLREKIDSVKSQLHQIIDSADSDGKRIFGYGASATGTVLMYHFNLGQKVTSIIDDNPLRQGRYSPGHHIPIESSAVLQANPESITIILAWRFAEMIIQKNRTYVDQGGIFIVPLPELSVINNLR